MPVFAPDAARNDETAKPAPIARGRSLGSSVRIVPQDHLLARIAAGCRCEVAEDHADLGGLQLHREVFLAGLAGDAVPTRADLEAGLAVDDAVIGGFFARLACVRDDGDRGVDPDSGEDAFEDAVGLLRQGCDRGGHGSVSFGCSGPFPMAHEETADLLRSARPKFLQNSIFRREKKNRNRILQKFRLETYPFRGWPQKQAVVYTSDIKREWFGAT